MIWRFQTQIDSYLFFNRPNSTLNEYHQSYLKRNKCFKLVQISSNYTKVVGSLVPAPNFTFQFYEFSKIIVLMKTKNLKGSFVKKFVEITNSSSGQVNRFKDLVNEYYFMEQSDFYYFFQFRINLKLHWLTFSSVDSLLHNILTYLLYEKMCFSSLWILPDSIRLFNCFFCFIPSDSVSVNKYRSLFLRAYFHFELNEK